MKDKFPKGNTNITRSGNDCVINEKEDIYNETRKYGIDKHHKEREIDAILREGAETAALYLVSVLSNSMSQERVKVDVAKYILDRVFGKAVQAVNAKLDSKSTIDLSNLTTEELLKLANMDVIELKPNEEDK